MADLWKFTPLHEAAAKGKYEICKLLLKVGGLRRALGCSVTKQIMSSVFLVFTVGFCVSSMERTRPRRTGTGTCPWTW